MRELIERGHVFIAQPPLYKLTRGKQSRYLKDEPALAEYLTQSALEDAAIFQNAEAPPLSGTALADLVRLISGLPLILIGWRGSTRVMCCGRLMSVTHCWSDALARRQRTGFASKLSERLLTI